MALVSRMALLATFGFALVFASCGEHSLTQLEEILFGDSSSSSEKAEIPSSSSNASSPKASSSSRSSSSSVKSSSSRSSSSSVKSSSSVSSSSAGYADAWDLRRIDTARDVDYMTEVEKDVILEMNKVRTDPRRYAELYLKPRLQYFNGNLYSVPGQITIRTNEGASAVQECIDTLSNMASVGVLKPEKGLCLAAKDHVLDQSVTGETGHDGSDGSTFTERILRYCNKGSGGSAAAENISYGKSDAREIVLQLLIDDGVSSRGHRNNIMKITYTQAGVAVGSHSVYGSMCVIDYTNNYITK